MQRSTFALALTAIAAISGPASGQHDQRPATDPPFGWVRTCDGRDIEGPLVTDSLAFTVAGAARRIAVRDLLSFHSAAPASAYETQRIDAGLQAIAGPDAKAVAAAVAELIDIGLPVLTPLLRSYADTDAHEPDPRYRLLPRLVPGHADAADRTLDLVRLADGETFRGRWTPIDLKLQTTDGVETVLAAATIRRLAILRPVVDRTFDLQALHHCTYVGWLDTGVVVMPVSGLRADAAGFVRLSFDEDGWATGPDGIKEPLPGKRKLQEGFRWGAVLGRVGPDGARWLAGAHVDRGDLGAGRLYFAVNDNEHWQNNIGSYRVRLHVTSAYDVGEAQ